MATTIQITQQIRCRDTVVIASDDENAASNDVDNATESSQISSALTAPRTPPKPPDLPRSLAKERDAQKLQEAVRYVEWRSMNYF